MGECCAGHWIPLLPPQHQIRQQTATQAILDIGGGTFDISHSRKPSRLSHTCRETRRSSGSLKKGLNPPSFGDFVFTSSYLSTAVKTGVVAGIIALAEGIAVGRSFAMYKHYHIDGNKEMVAIGTMNIVGSCFSCYLTTGPFSRSAVNFNAGCKTAMSNVIMAIAVMFTLLFLTPLFHYTPLVVLSAIIMAAMLGLIDYEAAIHLWKVDKFDFVVCTGAFLGVVFASVEIGLVIAVAISVLRLLLFISRPRTFLLGNIPNSTIYRNVEQYPTTNSVPGILILEIDAPIYFANASYLRERISRWIDDEEDRLKSAGETNLQYVILYMSAVGNIDTSGISMLEEVKKTTDRRGIKLVMANPGAEVMEKLNKSKFIETIDQNLDFPPKFHDGNPIVSSPSEILEDGISEWKLSLVGVKDIIPKRINVVLKNGQTTSIYVEVPWLPQSCRRCNVFGHTEKYCLHNANPNPTVPQIWKKKGEILPNTVSIHVGGIEVLQEPEKLDIHVPPITASNDQIAMVSIDVAHESITVESEVIVMSKEVVVEVNDSARIETTDFIIAAENKQKDVVASDVSQQIVVAENEINFLKPVEATGLGKTVLPTILKRGRGRNTKDNAKAPFSGYSNRFELLNSAEESLNNLEIQPRKPRVASLGVAGLLKELKSKKKEHLDRAKGLIVGVQGGSMRSRSQ
ncbi:Sulfate transporter 3.1 [Hibiscus syriacus]|uniref:Sulfate transporter 3.1 n=1 Tax=Hibiscus syriacus TaxID=106335 RepID=A0A6A2XZV6_HIBSY|nr:Sulfate transporter 3.1 [Hibiscus syriacus]